LERILKHIPTTATAVQKLNRSAKKLRKETRSSLANALDAVANSAGYDSWKHVTVCLEQTKLESMDKSVLPTILAEFLQQQRIQTPPAQTSQDAMKFGLVFAMDVKDAERTRWPDEVVEDEGMWLLAAEDILKVFVHAPSDLTGKSLAQSQEGEDLMQGAFEMLINYRFFVFAGDTIPATLQDAYLSIFKKFPHPPSYVWLKGKFIDMEDEHEIKDGNEVVFSSSGNGLASYQTLNSQVIGNELDSAIAPLLDRAFIPTLDISKLKAGFYEYVMHYGGQEMYRDAGYSSISEVLSDVTDVTGIAGYEVKYQGFSIGTYSISMVKSSAERIAQDAVATVAEFF
jgi:hypothetical protein